MNFNMWMLYDKLRAHNPVANIQCNDLRINGIRVMSMQENPEEDTDKLFVWLEDVGQDSFAAKGTVQLLNGQDTISLPGVTETSRVLNDLLEAYSYFNNWEARMRQAVADKSVQDFLDLATEILGNPMIMADMRGDIMAMSSAYRDKDINGAWVECREKAHLPQSIIGVPMRSEGGIVSGWTDEANVYALPDGTRVIGVYIGGESEYSCGLGIWNTEREFLPGDTALMQFISEAAESIIASDDTEDALHSAPDILVDMLTGNSVDEVIVHMLHLRYPGPWRLVLLHNPYYTSGQSTALKSYLLSQLRSTAQRNIAMIYEGEVVALVEQNDVEKLLDQSIRSDGQQYFIACLSQPFDNLRQIASHYNHIRFMLAEANGQPGTYYAENYGLQYILRSSRDRPFRLIHPALPILKAHDEAKNSCLYETLYQFLIHERSTQHTAQALHIHKNSLLYRINQIRELVPLDLDDPTLRTYLIISYAIDSDERKRALEEKEK